MTCNKPKADLERSSLDIQGATGTCFPRGHPRLGHPRLRRGCRSVANPICDYLNPAADVEDTARVKAQRLTSTQRTDFCVVARLRAIAFPRVPCHTIACDSALAELFGDLCQRHVEVTSQELNARVVDPPRKSIQKIFVHLWPSWHNVVIMKEFVFYAGIKLKSTFLLEK